MIKISQPGGVTSLDRIAHTHTRTRVLEVYGKGAMETLLFFVFKAYVGTRQFAEVEMGHQV